MSDYKQFDKIIVNSMGDKIQFRCTHEDPHFLQLIMTDQNDPDVSAVCIFDNLEPAMTRELGKAFQELSRWQLRADNWLRRLNSGELEVSAQNDSGLCVVCGRLCIYRDVAKGEFVCSQDCDFAACGLADLEANENG